MRARRGRGRRYAYNSPLRRTAGVTQHTNREIRTRLPCRRIGRQGLRDCLQLEAANAALMVRTVAEHASRTMARSALPSFETRAAGAPKMRRGSIRPDLQP